MHVKKVHIFNMYLFSTNLWIYKSAVVTILKKTSQMCFRFRASVTSVGSKNLGPRKRILLSIGSNGFVGFSTQKIGPICASPGGKMFRNPCNLPYFSYYFRNQKQLLVKAPPVQYYDRKKAMKAMNDSLKMWPIFRCRN